MYLHFGRENNQNWTEFSVWCLYFVEHFFFRLRLIAESCIQNLLEDENNILLAMPSCYAKLCNILENESNESEKNESDTWKQCQQGDGDILYTNIIRALRVVKIRKTKSTAVVAGGGEGGEKVEFQLYSNLTGLKELGEWLVWWWHNNVNVFSTTELYT